MARHARQLVAAYRFLAKYLNAESGGTVKTIDLAAREINVFPTSVNRAIFAAAFATDGRLLGVAMMNSNKEFGLWDPTTNRTAVLIV